MEFKVEGYLYNLECFFKENQVIAQGHIWQEKKPTQLRFPVGAIIDIKFKQKIVQAKIEKFTKNNQVVVEVSPTQKKKIDLQTLVSQNRFTEICYRIENDKGEGPYRHDNKSEKMKQWNKAKSFQYSQEREYGYSHLHPTNENDLHLRDYPLVNQYGRFGFNSLEQLNTWFTPEDLALLKSEGFNIVVKQKGLDYFKSFYSSTQMVIVDSEENYNKILASQYWGRY